MEEHAIYLDFDVNKWDLLYIINLDNERLENLKCFIDTIYTNRSFDVFKQYKVNDTLYDNEIKQISKLTDIDIDKLWFYNNFVCQLLSSSSILMENNSRITHITQYIYDYWDYIKNLFFKVKVYRNKNDTTELFSAITIFGYVGFITANNRNLCISIDFSEKGTDYNYNNVEPGVLLRSIFEDCRSYSEAKSIIKTTPLKYNCDFVISSRLKKFRIISRTIDGFKYLNNVYHVGTDTSFIVKSNSEQITIEKKILDIVKYPICKFSKIEELLFGSSFRSYVYNSLMKYLLDEPIITDYTIFFYICSITDDFYDVIVPSKLNSSFHLNSF